MASERLFDQVRGEVPYSLLHVPISDIREGQRITQCFLVKRKAQRSTRTGDPYLEILLADRTGTLPARAWAEATQRYASQFDEGEFVYVEARSETYRGNLQLIVESIRRMTPAERDCAQLPGFDPALLVPTTEQDVDKMWSDITALAESVESEPLRQLTLDLLNRHEAEFKEFPAAASKHHAYIGGLLEHTLEVAEGVSTYAERNPALGIRRDLAVAGAILHDIGKLVEFENPIAVSYTLRGQLIGHLLLGRDMIREAALARTWADPRTPDLLEHILISHHGELQYAAAMVPKTPEAIAVYHFDNLSAKLNMIRMHIDGDNVPGDFTDWESNFGRRFFKGELKSG
jgi:3'-5' exoribonuclease